MSNYRFKRFKNSSHQLIALILDKTKPSSVLDLGCDEGFVGRSLNYQPNVLEGVDIREVKGAKGYRKIWQADLDQTDFKFLKGKYQAIVMADVIEHLSEPEKLIKKIKPKLRKDGQIVISIPTGTFWFVKLLFFLHVRPQMDWGPFDRTHQHFFSLTDLTKLLKRQGFVVKNVDYTPVPIPHNKLIWAWQRPFFIVIFEINNLFINLWPQTFSYQIIVEAQAR